METDVCTIDEELKLYRIIRIFNATENHIQIAPVMANRRRPDTRIRVIYVKTSAAMTCVISA